MAGQKTPNLDIFAKTDKPQEPPAEETTVTISTRLEQSLRDDFEGIAQGEGVSKAELLRWLVRRFVDQYKSGEVELPKEPIKAAPRYKLGD